MTVFADNPTMFNQTDDASEFKLQVSKYPPTPHPDKLLPVLHIQVLRRAKRVKKYDSMHLKQKIESQRLPFLHGARIVKDFCQLNTMLGFLFLRLMVDVQNLSFQCQEEENPPCWLIQAHFIP